MATNVSIVQEPETSFKEDVAATKRTHAVVAAEDARFYQHHGFDWHEIQIAAEDDLEDGRTHGASTITQQLVKNLFFGTGPGIYGAGSACRYYDGTAARSIGREQAARLAAILPAPLKRRPERMNNYSVLILEQMKQMGW